MKSIKRAFLDTEDAPTRFSLINCPTLLLSGEKALEPLEKGGLAKAENQSWLSEAIPHSHRVELASGTLWMLNQMPEEVSEIVSNFLDDGDKSVKSLESGDFRF